MKELFWKGDTHLVYTHFALKPSKAKVMPSQSNDADRTQTSETIDFDGNSFKSAVQVNLSFGDFEGLTELARGGMGVVYKARQKSLDRIVALKMVLSGELASKEEVERFRSEAESAARLDHEGIVSIYQVGEIEGRPYFTMRLIDGESLDRRISRSPLEVREAAQILQKISIAIHYAHLKGVIHRDLKPGNVLLDRDGSPKITDFGLAKRLGGSSLTVSGQVLGTPSYMAPEQALGRVSMVDSRSDVYSLGAILYCMLTGRPPFRAATQLDTLLQVIHNQPVALRQLSPNVPRDLETICHKCLQKNPLHRYQSANEVSEELQRFLESRPIKARPVSLFAHGFRWSKRNPELSGAICAVFAVVLIGIFLALRYAEQKRLDQFATDSVSNLQTAAAEDILKVVRESNGLRSRMKDALVSQSLSPDHTLSLKARIALASEEPELANQLVLDVFSCQPEYIIPISQRLQEVAPQNAPQFWERILAANVSSNDVLRGASALANVDPSIANWNSIATPLVKSLLERNSFEVFRVWMPALVPVASKLIPALIDEYRSLDQSPTKRRLIAELINEYCRDQPELLVQFSEIVSLEDLGSISKSLSLNATRCRQLAHDRISNLDRKSAFATNADENGIYEVLKNTVMAKQYIAKSGRFALALDVPYENLQQSLDAMLSLDLEPLRVRCYSSPEGLKAAIIWVARTSSSTIYSETDITELIERDARNFAEGYVPTDLSVVIRDDLVRFYGIWKKPEAKPKSRTSFMLPELKWDRDSELKKAFQKGYRPISIHACDYHEKIVMASVLEAHPRQAENENWYFGLFDPIQLLETKKSPYVQLDSCNLLSGVLTVFCDEPSKEQVTLEMLPPDEILQSSERFANEGFLPAVCSFAGNRSFNLVWQREVLSTESTLQQESSLANLACLLASFGDFSVVQTFFGNSMHGPISAKIVERMGSLASQELILLEAQQARSTPETRHWILALGSGSTQAIPDDSVRKWVLEQFETHPDPGIHSAAAWTLKQLKVEPKLIESKADLFKKRTTERRWWMNSENHTMIQIPTSQEFLKGSPRTEVGRLAQDERRHRVLIPRSFAIASHEVTVQQFSRFRKDYRHNNLWARTPDSPAGSLTWYDAANYCNWLSEQEGISKDQWCYPDSFKPGERLKENMLDLLGYRLPTEAEWEFACRGGTQTSYHFGDDASLLPAYSIFRDNSDWHAWPVGSKKPNAFGLFDVYGNAFEWCHDPFSSQVGDAYRVAIDLGGPEFDDTNPLSLFRGGSVEDPPNEIRSACRNRAPRANKISGSGFRVCKTVSINSN